MSHRSNRKRGTRELGRGALAVLSLSCVAFSYCLGADSSDSERALREKWQAVYAEIAQSIEMRRGETKLALHEQPLLFYTNPVRTTDQHGTIFLWTDRGRPAVLGSIWSALHRPDPNLRNITHEFHSLSEQPDVQAARGGATAWSAGEPGIAWQALADSPAPASSRSGRLVQMRSLARQLNARITTEEPTDLRLMPQPLYRYPEKSAVALDGGLFVFALATDPELILLVEAAGDALAYRVALARFGNLAMAVQDGEREIWNCDAGTRGRSDGKYFLRWKAEQRKADLTP